MSDFMSVHKSSEKQTWETPQDFFDKLNGIFKFNLDACAEHSTAKVNSYFTKEENALDKDWNGVVCLIPARPETKMWQELIFKNASQVCFIKGRLKFGGVKTNAPFPSALVVFSGNKYDLSGFGYCIEIN